MGLGPWTIPVLVAPDGAVPVPLVQGLRGSREGPRGRGHGAAVPAGGKTTSVNVRPGCATDKGCACVDFSHDNLNKWALIYSHFTDDNVQTYTEFFPSY